MAQYGVTFDLSTYAMRENRQPRTRIYNAVNKALVSCGFVNHPEGSFYHTEQDLDQEALLDALKNSLQEEAPEALMYIKSIHFFQMEPWSDVTERLTGRASWNSWL